MEHIYRQLRNAEPPDEETARGIINKLFFSDQRYNLGNVGRFRMNKKLGLDIPMDKLVLTKEDIITIIKFLIELINSKAEIDDIDHLSNRRVRTVGEQHSSQFGVGLARMARTIRERMNVRDNEVFTPIDLINAKTLSSVINSFFFFFLICFEVRDVHFTHYGRLCPIETPEGPNIGLISSLSVYAKVNYLGFLETPYRKVENGVIDLKSEPIYLSAEEEEDKLIAQAHIDIADDGTINTEKVIARMEGDFPVVESKDIHYTDVAPNQISSISASLIPFLEHDDANRALMGSNMMRQAVPLMRAESPIVGTGLERQVASDSRVLINAEGAGVIEYVDANEITIKYDRTENQQLVSFDGDSKTYKLIKFRKTNQSTSINLKPIVQKGDRVEKGQVLCQGYATQAGELALGRNMKVAFMPWKGYNFEDAIVISEKVVRDDIFTSIHIDEYSLQVRDTKLGNEELRAIFGDKAGDVKDASLKASPSLHGVVINKKLFARSVKDKRMRAQNKEEIALLEDEFYKKFDELRDILVEKLFTIVSGKTAQGVINDLGEVVFPKGKKYTLKMLNEIDDYTHLTGGTWTTNSETNVLVEDLMHNYKIKENDLQGNLRREKFAISVGDELPSGILKLAKVYVAKKRKLKVGDKMAGRHGNKGIVARIVREEDMPFLEDGTPVDIVLNPLGVPSRMNIGQIYETVLGWAGQKLGQKYATPIFDGATIDEITALTEKAGVPEFGHTYLYDGGTGQRFDQKATVGVIYMIKLGHMIDDKMHARSIGPYSLITQQPLGGKAQFGGQRFGEMEVWALEAYGASSTLREILTVKSDDVVGRAKTYEAIVKGEAMPEPGLPESFNVLMHELKGLGLDIRLEE